MESDNLYLETLKEKTRLIGIPFSSFSSSSYNIRNNRFFSNGKGILSEIIKGKGEGREKGVVCKKYRLHTESNSKMREIHERWRGGRKGASTSFILCEGEQGEPKELFL